MNRQIKKMKEIIAKNKSFLITSHIGLEGDALGSQLALYGLLKNMKKKAFILNEDHPPQLYKFLPYIKKIKTDLSRKHTYDAAFVLDCPVVARTGNVARFLDREKTLINIDHHVSNDYFGDVNWVNHKASSCGEMIYELYRFFNQPIRKEVALLLYVAILTDTGSFAYESTTAKTHLITKDLIDKGLRPVDIHNQIYESKSFSEIQLLQKSLSTMRRTDDGRIAYLYVSKQMMLESGCEPWVTDGFINYARSIKEPKVAMFFLENPYEEDKIQISFRAKGEANVNELAAHFNGGGHRNAAGCVVKGSLDKVMKKVLETVKREI